MVCLGGRLSGCGAAGSGGSGEGAWLQENQMDSGGRRDYDAWRSGGVWLGRVYEEISRNRAIKVKKYEEDLKKILFFHTLVGFTGKNKKSIIKNGKKNAEKREKEERKETKEVSL